MTKGIAVSGNESSGIDQVTLRPDQRVLIVFALAVKYAANLAWVRKASGYVERWPDNPVYQLTIDQAHADNRALELVAAAMEMGDQLQERVGQLLAQAESELVKA